MSYDEILNYGMIFSFIVLIIGFLIHYEDKREKSKK